MAIKKVEDTAPATAAKKPAAKVAPVKAAPAKAEKKPTSASLRDQDREEEEPEDEAPVAPAKKSAKKPEPTKKSAPVKEDAPKERRVSVRCITRDGIRSRKMTDEEIREQILEVFPDKSETPHITRANFATGDRKICEEEDDCSYPRLYRTAAGKLTSDPAKAASAEDEALVAPVKAAPAPVKKGAKK